MSPHGTSPKAVAALFLERQHLVAPRARPLTPARLAAFAGSVGGIQIDTINVVDRAHHLTLWSRFGPYDRERFDHLAYGRRLLFEYWAHAACFVPTTDLPWWRAVMQDYGTRHTGWGRWLRRNEALLREVEAAIRERGPLGNADFGRREGKAGGWWDWKPATHALHLLWMSGRIHVHSRRHFQKRYDVAERVLPPSPEAPCGADRFARWHLERSLAAMGAATEADLRGYLTFPRIGRDVRRRALAEALAEGTVREVAVEGDGSRWYARAEDLPALGAAGRRRVPARGTTLLSPFDSLLWHRARAARLFGFDYRIQVYTPAARRVHGYYTMPILHDGQLVGRVDPKLHRAEGRLEVRHVHFEPWCAAGDPCPGAFGGAVDPEAVLAGVGEALRSLATFLGAERVSVRRVTPAQWLRPLRRDMAQGVTMA